MKIIEYEARNMIVLGDIHIDDLDRDVLQVVGLNGSGKSLLLSTFHPYSTSGRITKSYPIEIGKTGYKKVVFRDKDILWITEHEYTPKGESHSCKSYLTKIENGIREELNPTGHNILYKELVEKHLKYNTKTEEMSSLSESMNGITNSTSLDRKRTIESTIDADRIGELKKSVTNALRDRKGAAKGLQQHKVQLLSNKQEDGERLYLQSIEDSLHELETYEIPALNTELLDVERLIKDIDKNPDIDISLIKEMEYFLNNTEYNTINEAKTMFGKLPEIIKYSQLMMSQINSKKLEMQHWKQIAEDMESYEKELKHRNVEVDTELNELKKVCNITPEEVRSNERDVIFCIKTLGLWSSFLGANVINPDTIESIIREQDRYIEGVSKEIEEFTKKIMRFENVEDFNACEEVPKESNCDVCSLYKKFVLDIKWKEENLNNYRTWKEELGTLEKTRMFLNSNKSEDLVKAHEYLLKTFNNNELIKRNVYNLVEGLSARSFNNENLMDLFNISKDCVNRYFNSLNIKKELEDTLSRMTHSYDKELDDKYNEEYKRLTEEMQVLNDKQTTYEAYYELINSNSKYNTLDKKELRNIIDSTEKENYELNLYRNKRDSIKERLEKTDREVRRLISEKSRVREVLRQIDNTNKALLQYTKDQDELEILKEILEKDIPFHLLHENLQFIESEVNTILDGLFPYSIEIKVIDDEIVIPVLRHKTNQITPDIRNCSSGEKTVVGLLLNAAVLHILGYSVLCLDEVDAQLDEVYRSKFDQIIHIIMNRFNIEQVFCISHNLGAHISNSMTLTLGDVSELTIVGESKSVYKKS